MTNKRNQQTVLQHLNALRLHLLYSFAFFLICFSFAYYFSGFILKFLLLPFKQALANFHPRKIIFTGMLEGFFVHIKAAIFCATLFTFPFFLWQCWHFISPGLYKGERRFFSLLCLAGQVLFICGVLFAYFLVLPIVWKFGLSFENIKLWPQLTIELTARMHEYLNLAIEVILAFGLCFQLPVVILLLMHYKIVTLASLKQTRKYALLIIMIVSAIITPPDVLSMLYLSLPLYLLYELTIFLHKFKN